MKYRYIITVRLPDIRTIYCKKMYFLCFSPFLSLGRSFNFWVKVTQESENSCFTKTKWNYIPYVPPILGQVQIWVHKRVRVKFRVRVQVPEYGSKFPSTGPLLEFYLGPGSRVRVQVPEYGSRFPSTGPGSRVRILNIEITSFLQISLKMFYLSFLD